MRAFYSLPLDGARPLRWPVRAIEPAGASSYVPGASMVA